jgi:hypothetical protein
MEPLFNKKGKKSYKNYEIAHIYPLNPTPEEEALLQSEERLGEDVNHEDNLIPLCKLCHGKFDKPRTLDEYRNLVSKKKRAIERSGQRELWKQHHIEEDIRKIFDAIYSEPDEDEYVEITFNSTKIDTKLNNTISRPTRLKIKNNVRFYYTFIRERLSLLDRAGDCTSEIISAQIKAFYFVQKRKGLSQQAVFDNIVDWLNAKTNSETKDAAEIVTSFFVQNCEVFE